MSTIFGPAYDERIDGERIRTQMERVRDWVLFYGIRGNWVTLAEISQTLNYPEASVSSQLRHCKKARFGGYRLSKRRRHGQGLWEYQLLPPLPKDAIQMELEAVK